MERVCAECRFFQVSESRPDGDIGRCRLDKIMGVFRDSMRACPSFSRKGDPLPTPGASSPSSGASTRPRRVGTPTAAREVLATTFSATWGNLSALSQKRTLTHLLDALTPLPVGELSRRWVGLLVMSPADASLKSKEVELEQFLHKLVMIRDNLRVMEQKINAHEGLHDAEKIDLQARLTRVHSAALAVGSGWLPVDMPESVDPDAHAMLVDLLHEVERRRLALPMPALGDRWRGGTVTYGGGELIAEEPVEHLFHRLVVLRDHLLALEASIDAHPHIGPDEAGVMSSYARRCYGTLTTFNVLFRDREDHFSSSR
ncbi:MAG: hypothetical protein KC620_19155 [Myxococcales bacterium]|nr:hypothetical protein [Myxococcales bacterium]